MAPPKRVAPRVQPPSHNTQSLVIKSSSSRIRVVDFSLTWTIHDFSSRVRRVTASSGTPIVSEGSRENLNLSLELRPGSGSVRDHLSLTLSINSSDAEALEKCKLEFSILNAENQKFHRVKDVLPTSFALSVCDWEVCEFIDFNFLLNHSNGLLPDNKLTILCEGSSATETTNILGPSIQLKLKIPEYQLYQDFGSLLENRELSDVTISAAGKDFYVHKAILAARSPVFAAMFKHKMKETEQNRVIITDVDYRVLGEMLAYIYTGRLQNWSEMAEDLLVAADKYNVSGLKAVCEEGIGSTINVENTANLLVLADMYSSKCLKNRVIYFMKEHVEEVIETPAWKNMKLKHLLLAVEALEATFLSK